MYCGETGGTIKFRPPGITDMSDHNHGDSSDGRSSLPKRDENPYEDVDIDGLPDWWQEAVEEFRQYGLRPYRPPRFQDGTLRHDVVDELEDELDADIRFVGIDTRYGDDWTVMVDGTAVGTVPRRRDQDGFTVFEMNADEFRKWFRQRTSER